MRFLASALVAACIGGLCAARAQQHLPTNEDLRHLRTISDPQLSPDGKHVVALVQESTADGGRTHLWLLSTEGSSYRQLTFDEPAKPDAGPSGTGERAPAYLPDASAILFLMHREGTSGLFRLPMDGGEPVPVKIERMPMQTEELANMPAIGPQPEANKPAAVEVTSYSVAPDGRTIAVIAMDPQTTLHERDEHAKRDVEWVEHNERKRRLYIVDTNSWTATEAPGLVNVDSVSWSDDSQRLLVLTHAQPPDLGFSSEGWVLPVANPAQISRISGLPDSTHIAAWMHERNRLLLMAQCAVDAPAGCSDLFTFDMASGKLHNLTEGMKDSTIGYERPVIASDDRTAILGVTHGMHATAAEVDLRTGAVKLLDLGVPVVSGLRENVTKTGWVYEGSSSTQPPEVFVTADLHTPGKQIAAPELVPAGWMAVASKPISWKRAGLTIEGLLYMPPQASSGKVPLVVNVHGGPTGQFTDSWSPLTNLLLAQGWAVLITNPRGSTGYGVAFEAANKNDMGNGDYMDIMAGVDEAIRSAPIDPARMALIGYSYGGEMAGFVEGKTDRFKAIVSGAPVIDQFSEYGTEGDSFGDRWFTGQPWLHFESAWRQSPLAYAGHAKTPFLLLQGESDPVDPEGQSKEMYRALRQENVPVQLLLFPREDHAALGGNFAGRPSTESWAGIIVRQHMMDFIRDGFAGTAPSK